MKHNCGGPQAAARLGYLPTAMDTTAALETSAFFQDIDAAHRTLILERFRAEEHRPGTVLFTQGQPADRLYLLLSGRVEILFKPDDGDALSVTVVEPGGVFGWSAALGRPAYTSGATVVESSRCLSIRGRDLRQICEQHPATGVILLERLAEVIAQRLSSTHQHVLRLLRRGVQGRGDERP